MSFPMDVRVALGVTEKNNVLESVANNLLNLEDLIRCDRKGGAKKLATAQHQLEKALEKGDAIEKLAEQQKRIIDQNLKEVREILTKCVGHVGKATSFLQNLEEPEKALQISKATPMLVTTLCEQVNFVEESLMTIQNKVGFKRLEQLQGMGKDILLAFLANCQQLTFNKAWQAHNESVKGYFRHSNSTTKKYNRNYTKDSLVWVFYFYFGLEDPHATAIVEQMKKEKKKFQPVHTIKDQQDPCWT